FGIERIADRHVFRFRNQALQELVVNVFVKQQARARRADLALVGVNGPEGRGQRRVEVGVGKNDVRRLAAEFERQALQVAFAGSLQQRARRANAAGEGNL